MKSMMKSGVLMLLACGCMMAACDQDNGTTDGTTDTIAEPTADVTPDAEPEVVDEPVPDTTETYSVSGSTSRDVSTCPPLAGGVGTLCLSFRTSCTDAGTEVVAASVPSFDLAMFSTPADWTAADIPNGSYQLYAYLDDDESGCDGTLTSGDMFSGDGCVAVEVAGADVTGVTILFNNKQP
ncbi:MAG: hypothetical protein JRG91_10535 [Deltaproteobacteria bacterium]|nr:hypothetical protein [Deltaproteobacteria bacterium]